MNENVKIVFGLLGGLALFLYGMNGMSDALQKTAGDKMKKILLLGTEGPGGGDEILLHPRGERYFAGAGRKPMIDKNGATA